MNNRLPVKKFRTYPPRSKPSIEATTRRARQVRWGTCRWASWLKSCCSWRGTVEAPHSTRARAKATHTPPFAMPHDDVARRVVWVRTLDSEPLDCWSVMQEDYRVQKLHEAYKTVAGIRRGLIIKVEDWHSGAQ